jgi:hypothetical protein
MARLATARRPADRRTGGLDRPSRRFLPADTGRPAPAGPRPAADGSALSAAPTQTIEPTPAEAGLSPDAFWALLPAAEREQFGVRLSRLVLKAARVPDPGEDA